MIFNYFSNFHLFLIIFYKFAMVSFLLLSHNYTLLNILTLLVSLFVMKFHFGPQVFSCLNLVLIFFKNDSIWSSPLTLTRRY